MKIVTYQNTRAPAGYQAIARIFCAQRGAKGAVVLAPLPVEIFAADADAARAKAQRFWDAELERINKPPAKGRRPHASRVDPSEFAGGLADGL